MGRSLAIGLPLAVVSFIIITLLAGALHGSRREDRRSMLAEVDTLDLHAALGTDVRLNEAMLVEGRFALVGTDNAGLSFIDRDQANASRAENLPGRRVACITDFYGTGYLVATDAGLFFSINRIGQSPDYLTENEQWRRVLADPAIETVGTWQWNGGQPSVVALSAGHIWHVRTHFDTLAGMVTVRFRIDSLPAPPRPTTRHALAWTEGSNSFVHAWNPGSDTIRTLANRDTIPAWRWVRAPQPLTDSARVTSDRYGMALIDRDTLWRLDERNHIWSTEGLRVSASDIYTAEALFAPIERGIVAVYANRYSADSRVQRDTLSLRWLAGEHVIAGAPSRRMGNAAAFATDRGRVFTVTLHEHARGSYGEWSMLGAILCVFLSTAGFVILLLLSYVPSLVVKVVGRASGTSVPLRPWRPLVFLAWGVLVGGIVGYASIMFRVA